MLKSGRGGRRRVCLVPALRPLQVYRLAINNLGVSHLHFGYEMSGTDKSGGRSAADSCQTPSATAVPVDNFIPGGKPLRSTTASFAAPPSVTPRGAGSPEMAGDD
jgi:hypothetical protein